MKGIKRPTEYVHILIQLHEETILSCLAGFCFRTFRLALKGAVLDKKLETNVAAGTAPPLDMHSATGIKRIKRLTEYTHILITYT